METKLDWKTGLFQGKFEIYKNGIKIGELSKGNWKRKVAAALNNRNFQFVTKGFFGRNTVVIDLISNSEEASIEYSAWKSEASVNYQSKIYDWHFDNFFRTKWSLGNENGVLIKYASDLLKGTINSYTGDELLIISGFFIRNFFRQRSAGIASAQISS